MQAGWRIWPAAQLLNQSVVPIQFRTVSMDVVGFFWDMFLTFKVTGGGKAESITEGEEGVEADEGAGAPEGVDFNKSISRRDELTREEFKEF